MSTSSRTAIVIPTWNNADCLKITLDSLFKMTDDKNFRVIVVDNGSGKRTVDYLDMLGNLSVIRLEQNEGFVRGTNAGLAEVEDDEHVCMMNDDVCIVDPCWLGKLKSRLTGDVGACGPVSNYAIGSQSMQNSPKFPRTHESPFLVGFCMLVRSDAFRAVGLLDESFGMGCCDDLDYSIRLRDKGFKLVVDRSAFVFHWGSITIDKIGGYKALEEKNRSILMKKWGPSVLEGLSHV